MGKAIDLTGKRFGKLTAIRPTDVRKGGHVVWECLCDCGNTTLATSNDLKFGRRVSCGCNGNVIDIIGQTFGRLTVIRLADKRSPSGESRWVSRCICGNIVNSARSDLIRGKTRSCGCLQREIMKSLRGPLSPRWNPELTEDHRVRGRNFPEYSEWRVAIFERDNFTCQKCGDCVGGNLNAHHIEGYTDSPELRTELSNGVTLCKKCHDNYHHIYGYSHSTRDKFEEFMG